MRDLVSSTRLRRFLSGAWPYYIGCTIAFHGIMIPFAISLRWALHNLGNLVGGIYGAAVVTALYIFARAMGVR